MDHNSIFLAKKAWQDAEAILIGAGAGMGVDSGLPDFRGNSGFWKAYPPLEKLGIQFHEIANPQWFTDDPNLAWGFYGHRLDLYQKTKPHHGFEILLEKHTRQEIPMFIFTSNVMVISKKLDLKRIRSLNVMVQSDIFNAQKPVDKKFGE